MEGGKDFYKTCGKKEKLAISGGKMPAQRLHISGCGPQAVDSREGLFLRRTVQRALQLCLPLFLQPLVRALKKRSTAPTVPPCTPLFVAASPGRGKSFATGSGRRRSCSNPPAIVKLKISCKTKDQRNHYTGLFGGRGWIRTTEAESSRFTVCPHWPLGNTPIFICFVRRTTCLF